MGPLSRLTPRQNLRTVANGLLVVFGLMAFAMALRLAGGLAQGWLQLAHPRTRPRLIP